MLLLDLGLPGKDGLALLRAERERGLTLPVLIITARDAVSDRVQAKAQLPRDVHLFLDGERGTEHLRLARGQTEAIERVGTEARDLFLEQQCVRIAGQQLDGETSPVPDADERRTRRQSEPRGDRCGQPARVLSRPEVLGEPELGVEARLLDLAVAVEQHNGRARRRPGGEREDEPLSRLRLPQCFLEGGPHEIEHVAVALGELTLSAAEPRDDHLMTLRSNADRDAVLDA